MLIRILFSISFLSTISPIWPYDLLGRDLNPSTPAYIECFKVLQDFAETSANYTKCAIEHARPIRVCELCIDHYMAFVDKYNLLTKDINGTSCRSYYISKDRLEIVKSYHDNIQNSWNTANCAKCYNWVNNVPTISENTKKFNVLFNSTRKCLNTTLNPYWNNSEEVCQTCKDQYLKLDYFYQSLSNDTGVYSICMDIVDLMNATRSIWSGQLGCCKLRQSPEIIFICCTGIISSLPIFFYIILRFCGPIRDFPNILKQSRFKQTLLSSMRREESQRIYQDR